MVEHLRLKEGAGGYETPALRADRPGRTTVQYPGGQVLELTKALRERHGSVDWPESREPAV
ncbi:hypothetical protein [Streptomyces sp. NPDC002088]|uniref:hypothetical protein n=1 Tax=Streptomyces sp. NPDC002088 TaxID=3154665 RepID=UPI00332C8FFB